MATTDGRIRFTLGIAVLIVAVVVAARVMSVSMPPDEDDNESPLPSPPNATQPDSPSTAPATSPVQPPASQAQNNAAVIEKVTIAGEQFRLELSADAASRSKGMMGRTSIATYGGMLFVHTRPEVQSYWMANCLTDMDIMFLDSRGRIVATHAMKMEPPKRDDEAPWQYESRLKRYPSNKPAQFAIELKAGSIERLQLKPGMVISLDLERLKKLAK